MDLSKLFFIFFALCQTNQAKFGQDFKACWTIGVEWIKVLNALGPLCLWQCLLQSGMPWLTGWPMKHCSFQIEAREWCHNEEQVYPIFAISIWLYPFSIEFHILVVAVWWIFKVHHMILTLTGLSFGQALEMSRIIKRGWSFCLLLRNRSISFRISIPPMYTNSDTQGSLENLDRMEGYRQASRLFADCSSSNGGMFAGLLSPWTSVTTRQTSISATSWGLSS